MKTPSTKCLTLIILFIHTDTGRQKNNDTTRLVDCSRYTEFCFCFQIPSSWTRVYKKHYTHQIANDCVLLHYINVRMCIQPFLHCFACITKNMPASNFVCCPWWYRLLYYTLKTDTDTNGVLCSASFSVRYFAIYTSYTGCYWFMGWSHGFSFDSPWCIDRKTEEWNFSDFIKISEQHQWVRLLMAWWHGLEYFYMENIMRLFCFCV